ncbi:MAG: clan AA aspartic protease [Elusimicrobia bacterium]|nr:clan AA aspartic protease [Elusimicrobiota bacterium]
MGLVHVTVAVRASGSSKKKYEADFLVDTGATDCMAPASKLKALGIKPLGKQVYELADGRRLELEFGPAIMEFMGEFGVGRILFGPEDVEPILGVTILESCGIVVNPKDHTLKRLPAVPLKRLVAAA